MPANWLEKTTFTSLNECGSENKECSTAKNVLLIYLKQLPSIPDGLALIKIFSIVVEGAAEGTTIYRLC